MAAMWCCDARKEGADLWRQVWDRMEELPGLVQVVKVEAHLTYNDVLSGRSPFQHWSGNALADKLAKASSDTAKAMSLIALVTSQWKRARAWYKWVLEIAANWTDDTALARLLPPQEQPRQLPRPQATSNTHEN